MRPTASTGGGLGLTTQPQIAPGPPGGLLLGSGPALQRNTLGTFRDLWQQYGDVVRFRLFGSFWGYLLVHPEHVRHVLQENHRNYTKLTRHMRKLEVVLGNGLITSEGDFWLRQRRLIQPGFHHQRIEALGGMMVETTLEMLERWGRLVSSGRPINVLEEMTRLTVRIASKAVFSVDLDEQAEVIGRAVETAMDCLNRRVRAPFALPAWIPLPSHRRMLAARRTVDRLVSELIAARQRSAEDPGDLLSMLLQARYEDNGQGMDDRQLRDEAVSLFLAGYETTTLALSWTWYLLSRHPESRRRLEAELAEVLGGRPPTVGDLPRLPYTSMVIQETMRLFPPVWSLSRQPIEDDEVGGYRLPAGSAVFLVPYLTHRHPACWDNPEGFDPGRFAPERVLGRPRNAYFPFSSGPRQCIGSGFALLEAPLVLATVAQRYQLDLVPGSPVVPEAKITLRPQGSILVRLRPS